MSSSEAMKKHSGGVSNYRASEGKCVLVPYKGSVVMDCLNTLLGGIRSTCTYVGAKTLKELSKRTTFIRVMHHHNVVFGDEKGDGQKKSKAKKKDNAKGNELKENVDPFSMMSKEMKKEYFEFVYQREQQKLKQQQAALT